MIGQDWLKKSFKVAVDRPDFHREPNLNEVGQIVAAPLLLSQFEMGGVLYNRFSDYMQYK